MGRERLAWIDSLKGFTALCVVLGHVLLGYLQTDTFSEYHAALSVLFDMIYSFHMPLFFFISGYLFKSAYITTNPDKIKIDAPRFKKQLVNLIILYCVYSLLLGILKILFSDAVNNKVEWKDLLMIWAKPIQLYWYLYVLVFFYLSVFAVVKLGFDMHSVLLIACALSVCSEFLPDMQWFEINRIVLHGFFFYLGICFDQLERTKPFIICKKTFCCASVPLLVFCLAVRKAPCHIPILNVITASGISLIFVDVFRGIKNGQTRFLIFCGRYSLSIYLLHTYIATALRTFLPKIGVTNCFLTVVLSFALSTGFPILIEAAAKILNLRDLMLRPGFVIMKNKNTGS